MAKKSGLGLGLSELLSDIKTITGDGQGIKQHCDKFGRRLICCVQESTNRVVP